MRISQALEELRLAADAYALRTSDGIGMIPRSAQRPLYLFGPPGIGKTAIVSRVCAEKGLGLVSYTMTHHTRQTLLGLPALEKRMVDGREEPITEFTMPELIAEIHRVRERMGCERGILFLDEINCVSETLLPALLELLQNKRFGRYSIPEGWMLVCAGNPPAYNRSARLFDSVTMDRLRVLELEPELSDWEQYAAERGIHPAIRGYLKLRPEDFCRADRSGIVTPRAWTDLSDMLRALEQLGRPLPEPLPEEYLRAEGVAERFRLYHALTGTVSAWLGEDELLSGDSGIAERLAALPFDRAVFAAELIAGRLISLATESDERLRMARRIVNYTGGLQSLGGASLTRECEEKLARLRNALRVRIETGTLPREEEARERRVIARLSALQGDRAEQRATADRLLSEAEEAHAGLVACCTETLELARRAFTDPHVMTVFLAELRGAGVTARLLKREASEIVDRIEAESGAEARAERLRSRLLRETEGLERKEEH